MKNKIISVKRLAFVLVVNSIFVSIALAQNYTFQEINSKAVYQNGTFADNGSYLVNDFNNWYVSTRSGSLTQLGTVNNQSVYATAINAAGTIVGGQIITGSNQYGDLAVATIWQNGVPTMLNPGGDNSEVKAIGTDGAIYGHTVTHPSGVATSQAWKYLNGTYTYLSNGNTWTDPTIVTRGISGLMVGGSNNPERATIWQGTTRVVIGGQGGYQYSRGIDVNSSGKVLVASIVDYGVAKGRADIYDHGVWSSIGTYGTDAYFMAQTLNNNNQVLGAGYDSSGTRETLLLWQQGAGFTNLTNLHPLPGFTTYSVSDLNNNGEFLVLANMFTGNGYINKTFIASPSSVPEPSSFAALALGSLLVFRKRKQK